MNAGIEETIKDKSSRNLGDVTISAGISWKNLGIYKKYKLGDLTIVGKTNMVSNPSTNSYNPKYVYEDMYIRNIPNDGALVYCITGNKDKQLVSPLGSVPEWESKIPYYCSNFQWGMYQNKKSIFCRECCDVNNTYIYAYKWMPLPGGKQGLIIYDDKGEVVYNSNFKYMKVIDSFKSDFTVKYNETPDNPEVAYSMTFPSLSWSGVDGHYHDGISFIGYDDTYSCVVTYYKGASYGGIDFSKYINPGYSIIDVYNI